VVLDTATWEQSAAFRLEQSKAIMLSACTEDGSNRMQILYDSKTDLLYLRLDERKQPVINRRLSEDVALDMGEDDKIISIEILDASKHLNLERLLPLQYETSSLRRHDA
jgi:uncharacterized protein YuzE